MTPRHPIRHLVRHLAGLSLGLALLGPAAQAETGQTAKPPSPARQAQNQRMAQCSQDFKATGRPGSERRAFMKECLRKPRS
ncbi:MAG: hypothetical protein JOY84_01260 [Curvibacter sp.]|nr:hypothetical protein [Curvibacter sp.]